MKIDIQFIPTPPNPKILTQVIVIVIDVLRATSTMVHAMSQGATEIIPVSTVEEAFAQAKQFPEGSAFLGGERNSQKIDGFDFGNSPREYNAENVKGRRLILTTTNGTKAFHSVSSGKEILVGSFLNIGAVARRCVELSRDLLIFPSGNRGKFSLEDTVCGGMLIGLILEEAKPSVLLTDASQSAHILYQRFKNNLLEAFHLSDHGKDLLDLDLADDLLFCSQTDKTPLVPIFREGVIKA